MQYMKDNLTPPKMNLAKMVTLHRLVFTFKHYRQTQKREKLCWRVYQEFIFIFMLEQHKTTEAESRTQRFIYSCNGNEGVNKTKLAGTTN